MKYRTIFFQQGRSSIAAIGPVWLCLVKIDINKNIFLLKITWHWSYVNSILLDGLEHGDTKPFYNYIKFQKQDNHGISPLMERGQLFSDANLRPTSLVNILGPSSSMMTATPIKSISQEPITLTSTVVHPVMWSAEALSFPQPPQGIRPRWNSCEDPAISCNWHCPSSYSNLYPITVQTSEMPTQWGSGPQIQPTTARFPWPRLHVRCWSTYSAFIFQRHLDNHLLTTSSLS